MIKMDGEGVSADSLTYAFLIEAYLRLGLVESTFDVFRRMFDAHCNPCHRIYSLLIKHLSNEKLLKSNDNVVGLHMVSSVPSADIWKTVDFEIALELLEKMDEHGCAPNMNTYSELIVALCRVRNLEVARKLYTHMRDNSISPSEDKLYTHMRDNSISPSEDICNSLLKCCCELKVYEEAAILVDTMIQLGYLPALEFCKLLVCGLFEEENID
ncbi:hypothetical protein ACLB2K_005283 [Fragaria x ananassa]